jgi:hypothetical protein
VSLEATHFLSPSALRAGASTVPLVPRPAKVVAAIARPGGGVEELIGQARRRRNQSDIERIFPEAIERLQEGLHVRDLARHEELECLLRPVVVGEVDEPLVDDLGPRLRRDVAPQIDVDFAGHFQIVGRPTDSPAN